MDKSQRVSRGFHRLAIFLALLAFLGCMGAALSDGSSLPIPERLVTGVFVGLVFGLPIYGLVRAIGWVIGGFMASEEQ